MFRVEVLWSAVPTADTSSDMRRIDSAVTDGDHGGLHLRAVHRDQRGFVTGFVVRMLFAFVILVVCIEEVGQVVLAQTRASSAAGTSAQAAADDYAVSKNANHAQSVALTVMATQDPKARMTAFSLGEDGAVTVTAEETATTFLVQHLPYVKKFWVQEATVTEIHSLG